MKKIIPVLALIGGAAAFAVYKLKKEEQKKIIDLDQGLLNDEDLMDEEIEEGPIGNPTACCEDTFEELKDGMEEVKEHAEDFIDDVKKKSESIKDNVVEHTEAFVENAKTVMEDEIRKIHKKTKDVIENMKKEGDVNEHERPVQHLVKFQDANDLEAFKNIVINKGFVVTNGEHDLELNILHISPIDEEKLMANITFIANAAKDHHGAYEGWSSKVVY